MHIRGPPPNGKNTCLPFVAFIIPSLNLSGLNSLASSPHISVSRCIKSVGNDSITPGGRTISPSLVSSMVLLTSPATGGYSLKDSYKIIVTYQHSRSSLLPCKIEQDALVDDLFNAHSESLVPLLFDFSYINLTYGFHEVRGLFIEKLKDPLSFFIAAPKCCSRNDITSQALKVRPHIQLTGS
nr:cytochrome P450 CYP72A219-like [Ipomoea batatas]